MKPQDLLFTVILVFFIIFKGKYSWHAAMSLFILSGILFLFGNLFTAQRCTWYASALMLLATLRQIKRPLP